ncbi:MAG: hypothetical protein AAF593_09780 [Planctomycetota bacterium]
MKFFNLSFALMLALGVVVGCEEAKDAATGAADSAQEAADTAAEKSGDMVESLKEDAATAGEELKEAGTEALESGKAQLDEAMDAGKEKVNEIAGQLEEATATSGDTAASSLTLDDLKSGISLDSAQMDSIIEKVKGFIGEENYDTAAKWIEQLQGMELPEGYADQIDGLKGLLEKAQGAGELLQGLSK